MATVKLKLRASSIEGKEGTLYFRVIHLRTSHQLSTDLKLYPEEWDNETGTIIFPEADSSERTNYLLAVKEEIRTKLATLEGILLKMEQQRAPFKFEVLVAKYEEAEQTMDFISFTEKYIVHLIKVGRKSAVVKLRAALRSFINFHGESVVLLESIDSEMMEEYEGWLKRRHVCKNTISFYMRTLRTVYNTAVSRGLMEQRNPFKRVYTGVDKTAKRAVTIEVVRTIKRMRLKRGSNKDLARDIFMFSFYTRGMSFVDMAYLKKKDLQYGVLTYRRRKTNQRLSIKWEKPMQQIVDKYNTEGSPYLLPIIKQDGTDEWAQYCNAAHMVNRWLKVIGCEIGLVMPLTTYVARHGWASIAYSKHIPLSTISEALGHDSEKTTRIYLASLDTSAVVRANHEILSLL